MAPSTPQKTRVRHEYNTIDRTRFFNAFDLKKPSHGVGFVCHLPEVDIPSPTGRRWLKQRENIGSKAYRSQRKNSSNIGRKRKVSASDLERLTDQNNPEHEFSYDEQAKLLPAKPSARTLIRACVSIDAYRYKKPYVTEVSDKNRPLRVAYGQEHEQDTLTGFWEWTWFTDESHFQSAHLQTKAEYELRKRGQPRQHKVVKKSGLDVTIHVAGGISYNHKGTLIFYKDPQEPSEKQRLPPKPRKSKYESEETWQSRVKVWEDAKPKEDTTPKGNCMTQVFYAKKILPEHIKQIKALEERHGKRYRLQEDGDPSHGNRSFSNPPAQLKRDADLLILVHPPQSPDLNPIEAIWGIMKKRLRGRTWSTVAQFKADIQAEWDKITMAEIRRRIREMPRRCRMVQESKGERIKTSLW
jgi:hypothetical protein